MTKQIDELMAQVNALLFAPNHLRKRKSQELRTALDVTLNAAALAESDAYLRGYTVGQGAALKPGSEPFGYVNISTGQFFKEVEDCRKNNEGHWRTVYTAAPPAQTPPPRLTDAQINLCWHTARSKADQVNELTMFARAIESAVRKQFGVNDE